MKTQQTPNEWKVWVTVRRGMVRIVNGMMDGIEGTTGLVIFIKVLNVGIPLVDP
jgi:hypothetical protein